MSDYKIDGEKFYTHIQQIYNIFGDSGSNDYSNFKNIDAFAVIRGKYKENEKECIQQNTSRFHEYLLGYDFADSLIVFTSQRIFFLVASKKKMILEDIKKPKGISCPDINIVLRSPNDDNTGKIKKIFDEILENENKKELKLGYIKDEKGIGKTVEEFYKVVENNDKIQLKNTPYFIDEILETKDEIELNLINIAGKFSCFLLEYLSKKFEEIIENEQSIPHNKISNDIVKLGQKEKFLKKFVEKNQKYKINPQLIEIKNSPVIQSGGKYSWDIFESSDDQNLNSDVIICKSFGSYKEYNSYVIRTYMIDADKDLQLQYKILLASFEKLLSIITDSIKKNEKITLGEIYNQVKEFIISKDEKLSNNIPDCFGYGIGIEPSNEFLRIKQNSNIILTKNTCFFILLSFENIQKNNKNYVLQIGDTIGINKNCEVINYTEIIGKGLNDIHYNFSDENEDEEKEKKNENANYISNVITTRHMEKVIDEKLENAEKRKEHQEELLLQKNEEFKKLIREGGNKLKEETEVKKQDFSNIKSFDNSSQFPSEIKNGKIYISSDNFTIFLPLFKQMVPFHIALIKSTTKSEDNNFTILRINFVLPISRQDAIIKGENPVYICEISYKFKDANYVQNLSNQIKELQKKYKQKIQENKEKQNLYNQEKLSLRKDKRIVLNDLIIRPYLTNKKTTGVLEAHNNGFRFSPIKGEKCDIIYSNIKNAFLQTCETELIALIHFNLKNPIMIGKKKDHNVQFYREAGALADDLNIRARGTDYDEYEIELKERKKIEKMNNEFVKFCKSVEEFNENIKFDIPYRDLEFTGVPFKSNVTLFPTQNCLISLVENPPFVITLNEINIVYFERVSQSLKNFDMAFLFKDLSKPIQRITAIPMENLDMLKSWLDNNDILFGEGLYNMNWQKVIQKIRNDPEGFVEEGCWNFLAENASDDESDSDEEDPDPEYTEEEEEESESDYDDDEESYEKEESEGEDEGESALSEKGMSWDEMEEKAKKDDHERAKKIREEEKFKKKGKK